MKKKILALILIITLILVVITGCVPNDGANTITHLAGFWTGLWHGIILPITFIISLFNKDVGIYEVFNSGGWYNFGFLWGVGGLFSSSSCGNQ